MRPDHCNECIDVMDDRYNDWTGCIHGEIYTTCESEFCGGLCEPVGQCPCVCHDGSES